jgi:adenylate cyclase
MRLDPGTNSQYLHFMGMANLLAGNYEAAVDLFKRRITLVPETDFSRSALASALGHLGEIDEARRVWGELKEINPRYSFREHLSRLPFKRPEDGQRLVDGLVKAGLPVS